MPSAQHSARHAGTQELPQLGRGSRMVTPGSPGPTKAFVSLLGKWAPRQPGSAGVLGLYLGPWLGPHSPLQRLLERALVLTDCCDGRRSGDSPTAKRQLLGGHGAGFGCHPSSPVRAPPRVMGSPSCRMSASLLPSPSSSLACLPLSCDPKSVFPPTSCGVYLLATSCNNREPSLQVRAGGSEAWAALRGPVCAGPALPRRLLGYGAGSLPAGPGGPPACGQPRRPTQLRWLSGGSLGWCGTLFQSSWLANLSF